MEGNGGGGDDSGERCIEEHPVKGGRRGCVERGSAYPFNSHGVNDSRKKEKRRAAKMPKSQLARIYRFLPRGKRKLIVKLRFLLGEASRPFDGRLAVPRRSAHHRAECGASRRGVAAINVCVYEERPANSLGAEINTTLHSLPPRTAASGVADCACRENFR